MMMEAHRHYKTAFPMAYVLNHTGMKHLSETLLSVFAVAGLTVWRNAASWGLTILSLVVAVTAIAINVTRLLDWWDARKEKKSKK